MDRGSGKGIESLLYRNAVKSKFVRHMTLRSTLQALCAKTCRKAMQLYISKEGRAQEENVHLLHGIVVDEQLEFYVENGDDALFASYDVDPCVGTLIDYLDATESVCIAAQMPIVDRSFNVATSIDLIITDKAKRERFVIIEIKSTLGDAQTAAERFEKVVANLDERMNSLEVSYYNLAQAQLALMCRMVYNSCHFDTELAYVIRVSAHKLVVYPLNKTQFNENICDRFLQRIYAKNPHKITTAEPVVVAIESFEEIRQIYVEPLEADEESDDELTKLGKQAKTEMKKVVEILNNHAFYK